MGCRKLIWTPEDEPRASFARGIGGRVSGRRLVGSAPIAAAPFNGSFATLFPGAFQVVQTDLGLTYGGTPLATATNTSTTVLTLTGTLATVPVPIWAVATNTLAIGAGAQFNIYYDGLGVTPAMVGVTPAVATPVALTGAATGLSLAWSAGASVNADSWKATCAGLADQSGNTKNYSQATASKQPIVTVGLNGKPGLLGDGVDDFFTSTFNLPDQAVTPWLVYFIMNQITWVSGRRPLGVNSGTNFGLNQQSSSPNLSTLNGGVLNPGLAVGVWGVVESQMLNGATSFERMGTTKVTGALAFGPNAGGTQIFGTASANAANVEMLALIYAPAQSTAAVAAAVNSAAGYGVGNVLV